jgi:hypothetical protein
LLVWRGRCVVETASHRQRQLRVERQRATRRGLISFTSSSLGLLARSTGFALLAAAALLRHLHVTVLILLSAVAAAGNKVSIVCIVVIVVTERFGRFALAASLARSLARAR